MIMELYHLRDKQDPLTRVIKDDPVRPHIPLDQRVNEAAEILLLRAGEEILAATCMQWLSEVPEDEEDLKAYANERNVAVFYTIWSYKPGAGAELLRAAAKWLTTEYKDMTSIVTLSPQTEMARRFHLKNGASVHRTNETSVNYKYYQREEPSADIVRETWKQRQILIGRSTAAAKTQGKLSEYLPLRHSKLRTISRYTTLYAPPAEPA